MKIVNDYCFDESIDWNKLNPHRFSITGQASKELLKALIFNFLIVAFFTSITANIKTNFTANFI